jgi:hypothetical protein
MPSRDGLFDQVTDGSTRGRRSGASGLSSSASILIDFACGQSEELGTWTGTGPQKKALNVLGLAFVCSLNLT